MSGKHLSLAPLKPRERHLSDVVTCPKYLRSTYMCTSIHLIITCGPMQIKVNNLKYFKNKNKMCVSYSLISFLHYQIFAREQNIFFSFWNYDWSCADREQMVLSTLRVEGATSVQLEGWGDSFSSKQINPGK